MGDKQGGERFYLDTLGEAVEGATPGSDWWYDGRDIFHKPAGTNLDQIVIPLPETWHESQRVSDGDARLVVAAVNYARRVCGAISSAAGVSGG